MRRYLSRFAGSIVGSYVDTISSTVKLENGITCILSGPGTGKTLLAPSIIANALPNCLVYVVYPTRTLSVIALRAFLDAGGSSDIVGRSVFSDRTKRKNVRIRLISATELIKHSEAELRNSVVVFDDAHVVNVGTDIAMGYIDTLRKKHVPIRRVFLSHNAPMIESLATFWGSDETPVRTLDLGSNLNSGRITYDERPGSVRDIYNLIIEQIDLGRKGFIVYCATTQKAHDLENYFRKARRNQPKLKSCYGWHWTEDTCLNPLGAGVDDGVYKFEKAKIKILFGAGLVFREQAATFDWVDCGISDNLMVGRRCINNIIYPQAQSDISQLISETHSCDKLNDAGLIAFSPNQDQISKDPLAENTAATHVLPELFEIFNRIDNINDLRMFSVQSDVAKKTYNAHLKTMTLLGVTTPEGQLSPLGKSAIKRAHSPRVAAAFHTADKLGIGDAAVPLIAVLDFMDWAGGRFFAKTMLQREVYGDVDYSDILKIAAVVYGGRWGVPVCGTPMKTARRIEERCFTLFAARAGQNEHVSTKMDQLTKLYAPTRGGLWTCTAAFKDGYPDDMRDRLLAVVGAYHSDCLWRFIDPDMVALIGASNRVGHLRERFGGSAILRTFKSNELAGSVLAARMAVRDSGAIESAEATIITPRAFEMLCEHHPNAQLFTHLQEVLNNAYGPWVAACTA